MNYYSKFSLILIIIVANSCNNPILFKKIPPETIPFTESFDNKVIFNENWEDNSFGFPKSYELKNNSLKITTRPYSEDRVKIKTKRKDFGLGNYVWNIYVPQYNENDQCSIGAFIYHSGKKPYEIDFEIGSGNSKDRAEVAAKRDELLLFCTSQGNPSSSKKVKILEEAWYVLKLKMELGAKNKYLVKWHLNNKKIHEVQTNYGKRFKFEALCSLENIHFIGDKPTTQDNYTLFDYFKYSAAE